MNRTLVGLLALVALLIATPLMAQQRGRGQFGRGGGGFGVTKAALLGIENVQKELEIVADQKDQIAAIVAEEREGRRGGRRGGQDLSDEEREKLRKERADRAAAIDKKIDAVLVGPQKTRLNEIYVQALGTLALTTDPIAKELGIGEDLQEKIADARQEAMRAAFQDGGGGPEAIAKARAESEKAVLALLSADQKAKYEKMKGKPVSFDLNIGRGGRGGRRGGGN